ncbi:hypothetical protein H6F43_03230 [Leptolyngbya sp. FACHB-36]|uniref:hypothetical protein n=1 Tax=Leptolyngbya sp. FACHB-36 TaxID=2692808 RepID=UPI00167FF2D5|nr:hypothetical protein [Leptolyngbya sp. FACHB-36]MBD2019196.1 hypothetical protein [Leptolyngbya sp. FACHB-36]
MPNPNPVQNQEFKAKQFRVQGDEPLAKVRGVRLPQSVDAAIEALPANERSAWLKRVICEAAERELMKELPSED